MSQLQIGLISLGALIILAVLLFNWWQERNIRQEVVRRFDGPVDDVLMEELRAKSSAEPTEEFRIDPEAVLELREEIVVAEVPVLQDPVTEDSGTLDSLSDTPVNDRSLHAKAWDTEAIHLSDPEPEIIAPHKLPADVDSQIDEIAIIHLTQPCPGNIIRDALQPMPVFQKPVRWLGEDSDGVTMLLTNEQDQQMFSRVIATLQLADRSGPSNGEDLRNFHATVEELAVRIGGTLEWQEHGDPLQYARELDQFCVDVDVIIKLQLVVGGNGLVAGTKLRGVAEANGGALNEDGRFHFCDEDGRIRFMLLTLDGNPMSAESLRNAMLNGVMMSMEVPRVAHGIEAFNQMVQVGRKLETALASRMTDENQRPLGDAEIDIIRQQLKVWYSQMLARGVVPGSPTALRLFS